MDKIKMLLAMKRMLAEIIGGLLLILSIGWNARGSVDRYGERGSILILNQRADRDSAEIKRIWGVIFQLQLADNRHADRMNTGIRQTNRIFCAVKYPRSGIEQMECARREDRETGVGDEILPLPQN